MNTPSKNDILTLMSELASPMNCIWHPQFVIQSTKYWFRLNDDDLYKYCWFNILHEIGHQYLDQSNYRKQVQLTEMEVRMWVWWLIENKGWSQPTELDYIPRLMKHSLKMTERDYSIERLEGKLRAFKHQYSHDLFIDDVNVENLNTIGISGNNYLRNDLDVFIDWSSRCGYGYHSFMDDWDLEYVMSLDVFGYPDALKWDERKMVRQNPFVRYQHHPNGANRIYIL